MSSCYAELETVLMEVAAVVNRRPLTIREYDDDEVFPVAPADLLLGRMSGYRGTREAELGCTTLANRVEKLSKFVAAWWSRWQGAAFSLFTPRRKWRLTSRNLAVGDVVVLRAESKLGPGTYRLAVVAGVKPDEDGLVRTALITLRDRRKRGAKLETRQVPMAVQRLAVLLPVEERWKGGMLDPQEDQ